MKYILTVLIVVIFTINITAQQSFEKRTYSQNDYTLKYQIKLPFGGVSDTARYPLLLFLHGAGERGNDNVSQLKYIDIIFESEDFIKNYPAIIIAPQCPSQERWVDVNWGLMAHDQPKNLSNPLKLTMALLIKVIHKYNVDTGRIYVTGLSMGGYGTWDLITRYPDLFAAAVPLCGGADEKLAFRVTNLPIWVFHGSNDKAVPVERSRNMVAAIKKSGGNPKYTEYKGIGHFIWNKTYQNSDVWSWLFSQNKNANR